MRDHWSGRRVQMRFFFLSADLFFHWSWSFSIDLADANLLKIDFINTTTLYIIINPIAGRINSQLRV
jgi:hypothetical protein